MDTAQPSTDQNNRTISVRRGFIVPLILLLIISLIALAGVYYWKFMIQPKTVSTTQSSLNINTTPNPTANWKTYNGKSYIIKYPPEYNIKTQGGATAEGGQIYLQFSNATKGGCNFDSACNFLLSFSQVKRVKNSPEYQTYSDLNDFYKSLEMGKKTTGKDGYFYTREKNFQLGNEPVILFLRENPVSQNPKFSMVATLRKDNMFYFLSLESNTLGEITSNKKLFLNFLSTFKFTDETANWKTYTDSKISFKYPTNWSQTPIQQIGDNRVERIDEPQGLYSIYFTQRINYNNERKPFPDLNEYLQMNNLPELNINGQHAVQPLPRAGSENIFGIFFFSKDKKYIDSLELRPQTNNKSADTRYEKEIFDQILSTFKFTN